MLAILQHDKDGEWSSEWKRKIGREVDKRSDEGYFYGRSLYTFVLHELWSTLVSVT